jgi:hypothetical protein
MNIKITSSKVSNTDGEYTTIFDTAFEKQNHISITNWINGEGFDINIYDDTQEQMFSLSYESWKALKKVMKAHLNKPDTGVV